MLALVAVWLRAVAATWPAVLAWFLAGSVVREAVLAVAAPLGPQSALAAFLLLPLAALARLVAYVGMLLAVRRALPAVTGATAGREARRPFTEFVDVLLASVVPFFALYGVIGLLDADVSSYANRAALYAGLSLGFLDPGSGPLVVAVIVVAFLARQALSRFEDRLPHWTLLVSLYLEAVWVFVAVRGIAEVGGGVITWVQQRRVVHAVLELRQGLRDLWTPFRVAIDGIDGLVPLLLQVVALPLVWLLLAGVVYTRSLAAIAEERIVPKRVEARLRALLGRLPGPVARRGSGAFTGPWESVYRPFSVAARLVLRGDPRATVALLALSALLYAGGQWAVRGLTLWIGPRDFLTWVMLFPIVSLGVTAVVETVRIPLLGAGFDRALAARPAPVTRSRPAAAPVAGSSAARPGTG